MCTSFSTPMQLLYRRLFILQKPIDWCYWVAYNKVNNKYKEESQCQEKRQMQSLKKKYMI